MDASGAGNMFLAECKTNSIPFPKKAGAACDCGGLSVAYKHILSQ